MVPITTLAAFEKTDVAIGQEDRVGEGGWDRIYELGKGNSLMDEGKDIVLMERDI